ncbi:LysR family transcriptional regulator [Amycolatopsis nigrescens]|uniref:LysR family transcriptional regulator n=1 Tax=Amycolatopsis nigrescens TaxID=381445 RepID=UPI0003793EE7|nr:LysR family transcriptional regulator [Amycolatopsis nigrescens]
MNGNDPLRLPTANLRTRLLASPQFLLETTMDQLRTLIAVREEGTALAAARLLGREQSSVQKQLDTLNKNFSGLCGEPLVRKQGRGRDVLFTGTGEALVEKARNTLGEWLDEIHECRRKLGGTLTVGTTRFTLGYFRTAAEQVADEFRGRGIELKVQHVRTKDLLAALDTQQADLVCGSVQTVAGQPGLAGYDVLEWRRSGLALLTNLPVDRLPGQEIGVAELTGLPLVLPATGLITGFLRGWFGAGYHGRLDITAEIDDVHYGFELLRSKLVHGCMLVTKGVAERAVDGRLAGGEGLRSVDVRDEGDRENPGLEVLVGAFARRGESTRHGDDHPLTMLWRAIAAENA